MGACSREKNGSRKLEILRNNSTIWWMAFLIILMQVDLRSILNLEGNGVIYRILRDITLFDMVFPAFLLVRLPKIKENSLPREIVLFTGIYCSTVILLIFFHNNLIDIYYWFAKLYCTLIYLVYFSVFHDFGKSDLRKFGDILFRLMFVTVIIIIVIYLVFKVDIVLKGVYYQKFTKLLTYRLQLLTGNPGRLMSYLLVVCYCLSFYMDNMCEKSRFRGYIVALFLLVLAVSSRGRYLSFCNACSFYSFVFKFQKEY